MSLPLLDSPRWIEVLRTNGRKVVRAEVVPVHLALLNEPQQLWEGRDNLRHQKEIVRRGGGGYVVTDSIEAADLIVFLESNGFKNRHHIATLLSEELVRAYPEKCYALNYQADPVPFFPGIYTSLPRARQQEDWTRPGAYYLGNPNTYIAEYENRPWNPRHLFCFRGAMSHPLRHRLLELSLEWGAENPVTWVDRWFNHNEAEQRDYLQEIVDSQFVLCPRGIATSSHRLYETMRLGRVPIILADDWVPPPGPDWATFSITIAESAIDSIPTLLRSVSDAAPMMGRRAREAWERWFSPGVLLRHQLDDLADLAARRRDQPAPDFAKRWNSRQFFRDQGWSVDQRLRHRLNTWIGL